MSVPTVNTVMFAGWLSVSLHGKSSVAIGASAKYQDWRNAKPAGQVNREGAGGEMFKQGSHQFVSTGQYRPVFAKTLVPASYAVNWWVFRWSKSAKDIDAI